MQVKVCAKCGTENKIERASCANCYGSLSDVASTLRSKPQEPVVAKPKPAQPEKPASPGPGPHPLQPGVERRYVPPAQPHASAKSGSGTFVIVAFVVLLIAGGGGFAAWHFVINKPQTPEQLVKSFLSYKGGDYDRMKDYMTQGSIDFLANTYGGEDELRKKMKESSGPLGVSNLSLQKKPEIRPAVFEGDSKAFVEVALPDNSGTQQLNKLGIDLKFGFVCAKEQGKWKIDLPDTSNRIEAQMRSAVRRMFGGSESPAMPSGAAQPGVPSPPAPAPGH